MFWQAYENGGGAFLIPYIIVLFLIGKRMFKIKLNWKNLLTNDSFAWKISYSAIYYLEMALGKLID